jgi:hypothetical protein
VRFRVFFFFFAFFLAVFVVVVAFFFFFFFFFCFVSSFAERGGVGIVGTSDGR